MRLSRLLAALGRGWTRPDAEVAGIVADSRLVKPGDLFVALPGLHVDGAAFVGEAFARGAVAVVAQEDARVTATGGPVVRVPDARAALSALAAAWYDRPAERLITIGVTGTDGKTTTCYLLAQVLERLGPSGLFTTVAYKIGPSWEKNPTRLTTPEAPDVQALLQRMVDAGVRYAVLESSSHGLALKKLDDCAFDVAVFTNLSPDHLDFHGTMEAYRDAKARLFALLATAPKKDVPKAAIVNTDDSTGAYMAARAEGARVLRYGFADAADVRVLACEERAGGTLLRVATPAGPFETRLLLPGRFNVMNALAATGAALACGMTPEQIGAALAEAHGPPGRLQRIEAGQPFTVIVDYAHTGAALERVLAVLRPLTTGRIVVVFGCAGERGLERRSGMAAAAAAGADYAVLTSEDPRSEDPEAIIADIARELEARGWREGQQFEREPDRRAAIARAFALARPGDLVLLAGKGHETTIETAAGELPWDEAAVAAELLSGLPAAPIRGAHR